MQLTFLGTGPSPGIPRLSCRCQVCRDARKPDSKSRRTRSAAIIETGDKKILIDAGPDILMQLKRVRVSTIDAVLLTHAHADAAGGIYDVDELLAKQKYPATLFAETGTLRRIDGEFQDDHWLAIKQIQSGRAFRIGSITITPFRVHHSMTPGFPTLGFCIGQNFVYASDVSCIPKSSERYVRAVKHMALDGCMWFGKQIRSHLTVDRAMEIAERLGVHHLYLTQISHTYPPYREAIQAIQAFQRKEKFQTEVVLAYDGLSVEITG